MAEELAREWLDDQAAPEAVCFNVLPENWPIIGLFIGLKHQWRRNFNGRIIGFDYGAIPAYLTLTGTPRRQWPPLFAKLRVMEDAALSTLYGG